MLWYRQTELAYYPLICAWPYAYVPAQEPLGVFEKLWRTRFSKSKVLLHCQRGPHWSYMCAFASVKELGKWSFRAQYSHVRICMLKCTGGALHLLSTSLRTKTKATLAGRTCPILHPNVYWWSDDFLSLDEHNKYFINLPNIPVVTTVTLNKAFSLAAIPDWVVCKSWLGFSIDSVYHGN
jgi:hypothetical protein